MLDFPTKTINYIKNLLLKQQKEIEKNLKEVEKDDPAISDELVESSEPGTDSYVADTHTKYLALKTQLKKNSTNIKNALFKIAKGTYGKCEKCHKRIGVDRLIAMPTASDCLLCPKRLSNKVYP